MSMEQFKALLESSEGLTEDFKKSAEPIFLQAIEEEVNKSVRAVEEKYDSMLKESANMVIELEHTVASLEEECDKKAEEAEKEKETAVAEKEKEVKESFDSMMKEGAKMVVDLEDKIESLKEEHSSDLLAIQEQVETLAEERLAEEKNSIMEHLNAYMDYAVKEFVEEYRDAILSCRKQQIEESFMQGLSKLFASHSMKADDATDALREEVESMKSELILANKNLSEQLIARQALEEQISDFRKAEKIRAIAEEHGFSVAQRERLSSMMEGFVGDESQYMEKANTFADSILGEDHTENATELFTESIITEPEDKIQLTEGEMLANMIRARGLNG